MTALLLYPNQLFDVELLPKVKRVYLVEEPLLFGTDKDAPMLMHKSKLVLMRASMRRYAEEVLWPNGFEVEYVECGDEVITDTALVKAAFDGANEIVVFDPCDHDILSRLESASQALEVHVPLRKLENPGFYLKTKDIDEFFKSEEKKSFVDFYQYMRERFDVLIDGNYHPFGGKWTYDQATPKRLAANVAVPGTQSFGDNDFVREAVTYVELKFPNNPGRTDTFVWPTNREEALLWMEHFFKERLKNFAKYQSAILDKGLWLFHSALSPVMNIGLLSTRDVVESVMDYCAQTKVEVPIESLENFVRSTMGQREYVRAMYHLHGRDLVAKNAMGNHRKLTVDWYEATTGLPPLDRAIDKASRHGYLHGSEWQICVGNLMLLADIDPVDVYRWTMAHSIDAFAWSAVPNVFGMSQFVDGGGIADKPAIYASNHVLSVSDYTKDRWCDVWDGLYWRFIDTHRLWLKKNPRFGGLLVGRYDAMEASRKRIIGYRAQDFLDRVTVRPAADVATE